MNRKAFAVEWIWHLRYSGLNAPYQGGGDEKYIPAIGGSNQNLENQVVQALPGTVSIERTDPAK